MNSYGKILFDLRRERELSLDEVSKETGITDSRLSRIEKGTTECPPDDLVKLAHLYKKNVIELFIEAGYISDKDLCLYQMQFHGAEKLSVSDKALIQSLIDRLNSKSNKGQIFRLGELFCGPGGLGWGAINARIDDPNFRIVHAWANDFDLPTCETYTANICPDSPETVICEDVHTLDMSKLGPIDALAFGFPCNDFSVVGEQKGFEGVYGPLYTYGVKALKLYRPKWFLAENVSGLSSANEGNAFSQILKDLRECGYILTPNLYRFEDYGVPQARHRIIIVGIRNDIDVTFKVPSPAPYSSIDNTCRTAIEIPPIPDNAANNEQTKMSSQVIERLTYIKPGQNAFNADLPDHLKLNVKGAKMSMIYKRLDPEKPAYTVTGSGGGGTHIYHWSEPRALTNRERARLQTFPDDFVFKGSKESVRKQIGMAVPCRGAQIIFEAILNSFAGIEYEWVAPNIED